MFVSFSLLFWLFVLQAISADELLLVQALWRHGDRSPLSTFPKDQYQQDHWPQGWGQLSATGMKQHYALGAQLRAMYNNFISFSYKPSEIYVRSTDVDRTLMSAMSNLAGFYQTGAAGITYPDSNSVPTWPSDWSPIPVHPIGDALPNSCPRQEQLYKMIKERESYKFIKEHNQPLLNYLTNVTGMHISLSSGIRNLQDTLFIEKTYNLKMPTWLTDSIWKQIVNLSEISDDFEFGIYPPQVPELIKLRGGSLLKVIIKEMQMKLNCMRNPSDSSSACLPHAQRKYYIYSAHDTTLADLLTTFRDEQEVVGMGLPKYAASILIELWDTANGPQVKILYHPEFHFPFRVITSLTEGCPSDSDYCPFEDFVSRSQKYIPIDINAECRVQ